MSTSWFPLQTDGANTWTALDTDLAARTAVVSQTAAITVGKKHDGAVSVTVSCTATVSTGSVGYITGGGPWAINTTNYNLFLPVSSAITATVKGNHLAQVIVAEIAEVVALGGMNDQGVAGTAAMISAATITPTITTNRGKAITLSVLSALRVNTSIGEYPDLPQLIGSVREITDGTVINRSLSGKPRFRRYFTRPRAVFKIVHEGSLADKQLVETHYSQKHMNAFEFTFAPDSTQYQALYAETPKFTPIEGEDRWRIETLLIEQ